MIERVRKNILDLIIQILDVDKCVDFITRG